MTEIDHTTECTTERTIELLKSGPYTCVLSKGEKVWYETERGVKPLVDFIRSGEDFTGAFAADKVVGKGAAFLYARLKVKAVYAGVISKSALAVLKSSGIETIYETVVENIINRKGDGICPFEEAVLNIRDPDEAYDVIIEKMSEK